MLTLEEQIRRMEENINTKGFSADPGILAFALEDKDIGQFVEAYKTTLQNYLAHHFEILSGITEHQKLSVEDVAIAFMTDDFDNCVSEQTYVSEGRIYQENHDKDKEEIIRNYLKKQGYIGICEHVFNGR